MHTRTTLNWSRWNAFAGVFLLAVVAILAGAAIFTGAASCKASPAAKAEAAQLDAFAKDSDADAAAARAAVAEGNKAIVAAGGEAAVTSAALQSVKALTPEDTASIAALQAKLVEATAKVEQAHKDVAAARLAADDAAARAVEARQKADAVIAKDLQAQAAPWTAVLNAAVPGSGAPAQYLWGALGIPLLSKRGREHYMDAAKAILPLDGKVDVLGGIAAAAKAWGLAHTTGDPMQLGVNAAAVAREKGMLELAVTIEAALAAQKAKAAQPIQPLPLGAAVPVAAAA